MVQLAGPETATRAYNFSDWGEPVGTQWTDGTVNRQLVRMYDSMGRLTATEERELENYLNVGRTLEFLKAKARLSLQKQTTD